MLRVFNRPGASRRAGMGVRMQAYRLAALAVAAAAIVAIWSSSAGKHPAGAAEQGEASAPSEASLHYSREQFASLIEGKDKPGVRTLIGSPDAVSGPYADSPTQCWLYYLGPNAGLQIYDAEAGTEFQTVQVCFDPLGVATGASY